MGEGEHRHLTCAQACGQCEQCSQAGLRVTSDRDTTDMPPLGNGSSDEEGSHAALPTRGRKYRGFPPKGRGELLRGGIKCWGSTFVSVTP